MGEMDEAQRRAAGAYKKVQGLLKEVARSTPPSSGRTAGKDGLIGATVRPSDVSDETKLRDVAGFLTLVGRDEAAAILKRLPEEDARRVVDTMAHLEPISRHDAMRILTRFGAADRTMRTIAATGETRSGPETAREILVRAFGPEWGERRFYEILPEEKPYRFAFLEEADGKQLSFLLRNESVPAIAIMCANMPRHAAARLLGALEREKKGAVVQRIANMGPVAPEVLDAVEKTLRKRLEAIQRPEGDEIDGEERLAEILRYMDLPSSDRILHSLGEVSAELAEHIRSRLSTPEDILYVPDRDVQKVLQRVDDVDLATIIKGKSEQFVKRLQGGVSQRRWELILMQRESLGPMKRSDVDRVTTDFMKLLRDMALKGEIVVQLPGEDEWVT